MSIGLLVVLPFAAFCAAALWATFRPDARPVRWHVERDELPEPPRAELPAPGQGRVTGAIVRVRETPPPRPAVNGPVVVTTLPAAPPRALPAPTTRGGQP